MKKIMFNDRYSLTENVLDKNKTMTRRLIKAPKRIGHTDTFGFNVNSEPLPRKIYFEAIATDADGAEIEGGLIRPRWKMNKILAIAQNYKAICEKTRKSDTNILQCPCANSSDCKLKELSQTPGWKNKMFVKTSLTPCQIKITDIQIERLQDISDDDCLKEGIRYGDFINDVNHYYIPGHNKIYKNPREAFASLIRLTYGKNTWEKNPFVFVYTFSLN